VPGKRRFGDELAQTDRHPAEESCAAALGYGRWHCRVVSRRNWICEGYGTLEITDSDDCVRTAGSEGRSGHPPDAWEVEPMNTSPAPNQMPAAEIVRLGDLVQYQPGSVVSRTILKRPNGTVTLFAFDQGQGLSEHTAAFDALVQVIEGEGEFTIAGKAFHLIAGQTILLPANQPHAVLASARFKMLLTMLRA
jgi:quercetin dioxygenase-like cupin family protein